MNKQRLYKYISRISWYNLKRPTRRHRKVKKNNTRLFYKLQVRELTIYKSNRDKCKTLNNNNWSCTKIS